MDLVYYQAMKRWKLILYSILICLPGLMLIACWTYGITVWMPNKIRAQQTGIGKVYRREAIAFIANPEEVSEIRTNRVSQQVSQINGIPWGRLHEDGRNYVWFQAKGAHGRPEWRLKEVEVPEEVPYRLMLYAGGGVVALTLIGLSLLATLYYVRLMRERDDFLAATAHDLTTPLVGMRMMIGRNDEEAKALNERMIRLVDNIKDFLKLGGRRPVPKREAFDLVKAYGTAYALFAADYRDLFDGEDIKVDCGRLQSTAVAVTADETMTVQILWNLLGNDLKYAAPYGKVSVRFAREGEFVRVEFIDEGQGMTPRQMRKAFDRYYRAKTVLQSGKGGFGIGLCTAKEFARAMGGDLTVRANTPRGCIFSLYLPAAI